MIMCCEINMERIMIILKVCWNLIWGGGGGGVENGYFGSFGFFFLWWKILKVIF